MKRHNRMLETIRMIYVIQVFRRRKLSSLTDKVFTWDALLKFQKFWKINKFHGIIIRKIKDGKWPDRANFFSVFSDRAQFMPHRGIKWKKFCVAYNFNWLINLLSFPSSRRVSAFRANSYEVKYSPTKYIDTTERGLVVVSVNEGDAGRYDCHLGGSLLCSYSITVDAHR